MTQLPAHTCPAWHALPHTPQLALSVPRWTQVPLQFIDPDAGVQPNTQIPLSQA